MLNIQTIKSILLSCYILISTSACLLAQKEANFWYFGFNAGLDFSSGSPVSVSGGQVFTLEGCATISDPKTGNLLFYTDGRTIWTKNHTVMQNGNGLLGSSTSTQSGVIVPLPASDSIFYVFAVDAQIGVARDNNGNLLSSGFGGVSYSIVDLSLNTPLGAVDPSNKNIPLLTPTDEKLTAVKHCNGEDIWIITHKWKTDSIYAFLLTKDGLSSLPVGTKIGPTHNGPFPYNETLGYLKASPNGKKLAEVTFPSLNQVEIYDFDNSTGVLSNAIIDTYTFTPASGLGLYGLTFSPDNSKLYVSVYGSVSNSTSLIYQYDLLAGNAQQIIQSKTMISSTTVVNGGQAYSALQIGPDGKIYVSKISSNSLDVINKPNKKGGECDFQTSAVTLSGGATCGGGLPDFIESIFDTTISFGGKDTTVCGDFILNAGNPGFNYLWSTGETTAFINAGKDGLYWVTAYDDCQIKTDTINVINVGPFVDFPDTTSICALPHALNAENSNSTYLWSTGETISAINAELKGLYSVTVTNSSCSVTDSTFITLDSIPPLKKPLPNVFSPNNDYLNDLYVIDSHDLNIFNLKVFDNWGRKVFESTSASNSWDGKFNERELPNGNYFWRLEYNSECYSDKNTRTETGFVYLTR